MSRIGSLPLSPLPIPPSHTLESESARPAPPSSAAESIKHWSKNAGACVCGGRRQPRSAGLDSRRRTGWRSCSQTDNKMDQGIGGSPTKNEGLPQNHQNRRGPRPTSREGTCAISGPTFDDLWTSFHHSREKRVNADPHRENVVLDQIMQRKTFSTDIIDDF